MKHSPIYRQDLFPIGRFLYIDFLALICGMVGGAVTIWFLFFLKTMHGLIFGDPDLIAIHNLPWWRIVGPLLLAGLIAGYIARHMRYQRPFGVAGVVEGCALRNGHMPLKEGLLNALLHKSTLALGVSTGREGPAIHLSATLLTPLLMRLGINNHYHVLLIGCAVAGSIGASFHTALAGALFAWEVVIGRGRIQYILPLAIGGGGGLLLSYLIHGSGGLFYIPQLPDMQMTASFWIYPAMALFGASTGVIGGCFASFSTWIFSISQRKKTPIMVRTISGAIVLAGMTVLFPSLLGVGYGPIYLQLFTDISIGVLIAVFALKLLASSIALGTGLGGGVWTLCVIFGAVYGTICGALFDDVIAGVEGYEVLFMLVGMAGFITSILGAPLTGILFVIEHNGQFEIVLLCLIAVIFSAQTVSVVFAHSYYSETLSKGMGFEWTQTDNRNLFLKADDLIEPADSICGEQPISAAYKLLQNKDEQSVVFVTDYHDDRFIGVIGWQELSLCNLDEDRKCFEIMGIKRYALQYEDIQHHDLGQVWDLLEINPDPALPVVGDDGKIIGCIKRERILAAMQEKTHKNLGKTG